MFKLSPNHCGGNTHIVSGINDFDFGVILEPGQNFDTPVFYVGFTEDGFGDMSRYMYRFVMENILSKQDLWPVLYNSCEATTFNVQVDEQKNWRNWRQALIVSFCGG